MSVSLQHDKEIGQKIDALVGKAVKAKVELAKFSQEQVDKIVESMALAGVDAYLRLAHMAVEETKMGICEDKAIKNLVATEYVFNHIRNVKTVGVLHRDEQLGITEYAEPIGVIAGVTPVTNPTSTTMFKSLIAMKTRNPIIFAFHPKAQNCSAAAAKIMLQAAIEAGAPEGCISWIEEPSIEATNLLMTHPGVDLILATGGSGLVKAAYSSGKPALGVGPGNVPAYIEKTANIPQAVHDIVLSKTFDNGTICASEQAIIVDEDIASQVKAELIKLGGYFLNDLETKKVEEIAIDAKRGGMSPQVVGQSAETIARLAGIRVPAGTRLLIAPLKGVGEKYPLSREKLSPIIAYYEVKGPSEGIKRAIEMTEFGGLGHSAVIHSTDQTVIDRFCHEVKVGRLLINSPSALGGVGDSYNYLPPSFTLGCGSAGGNSTADNVGIKHLISIKRRADRKIDEKWFRVPPRIYFEPGSIRYLAQLKGKRAQIVTDKMMVSLGYVDKATRWLDEAGIQYKIFSDVEPDPSVETVMRGVSEMRQFEPDTIIAIGGGSAIDAGKCMWLFYEHPDITFQNLKLRFQDIRKRAFLFPQLKAEFVAIPTTSGTGSEVTAFTVITDRTNNIKYPITDYAVTPHVAIIDPDFTMTIPPKVTADTGLDVLVHALEAYVSIMASDYTDALALKAIEIVFEYLPKAYKNGSDRLAREKMHNASCLAGMAFTNAFLGINHSLAHALGGEFHIPHGRANAVLMPAVIKYNGSRPTKLMPYPKYNTYQAPERYARVARMLGLQAETPEEGVNSLIAAILRLMEEVGMPLSIKECGVPEKQFEQAVDKLANQAFADQCTVTNPRLPLIEELKEILRSSYVRKVS